MIETRVQTTADGAILFDAAIAAQAGIARFDPDWFDPAHWHRQNRAIDISGGRGGATFIDAPVGACVLRHYRRGGMVAQLLGDRYLWSGAERTRSFAEFRLLGELLQRGLPVPMPIAARYQCHGVHYCADLIMRRIEGVQTLAQLILADCYDNAVAARIGLTLARFHMTGAYHADLNAHNVLLDTHTVWLVDFDRGELRSVSHSWRLANLARLRRSMLKLGAAKKSETQFDHDFWQPLMAAYECNFSTFAEKSQVRIPKAKT